MSGARPATAEAFVARGQARRILRLQTALTEAIGLLESAEVNSVKRERAVELRKAL